MQKLKQHFGKALHRSCGDCPYLCEHPVSCVMQREIGSLHDAHCREALSYTLTVRLDLDIPDTGVAREDLLRPAFYIHGTCMEGWMKRRHPRG